jgi:hypothetical protein
VEQAEISTFQDERKNQLQELESIVDRGREVFIQVGEALDEIRSRKLYEPDYPNFDAYCRGRFGWTRRYGDRHIQ